MIEIPRFSASELKGIVHLFGQEGVPFDYRGQTADVSQHGGANEYFLVVDDEDLEFAVELLMEFFGIAPELDAPFVGLCPACEADIDGAVECPGCGLSLSVGTPAESKDHPFYRWLNGMLQNQQAEQQAGAGDDDAQN